MHSINAQSEFSQGVLLFFLDVTTREKAQMRNVQNVNATNSFLVDLLVFDRLPKCVGDLFLLIFRDAVVERQCQGASRDGFGDGQRDCA